ncbi:class I SAM-dependent methyltransferase [uncultured Jatrophihabitans sp.]|uniref:class I SAM-dependent methyltransferase n=1 Tax=uncultured Jatrophihabitans sp. TaxID=1610747 RepID=UPI0035CAF8DB
MPDPIFAHPRLAQVYDTFDGPRDDLAAYVAIADELNARRVVDLGCGTGSLSLLLARTGRHVIALDPARASLDVARAKPHAEEVTWVEGTSAVIPADANADLVVMTGNAAQAVVEDQEWTALLHDVYRSLVPGGCFTFETRRPERRPWDAWATAGEPVTANIPGLGVVEQRRQLIKVDLPLVSFRLTYRFLNEDTTHSSDSTLRFRGQEELTASLMATGFTVRDVREAPDRPGRELVFLAHRPRD